LAEHPWQGDFAAARNTGLDLARGEWILYIDADERFSVHGDLNGALADASAVAGLVRFRAMSSFTPYLEYRLFRRRPDVRFRGAMHETVLPDLTRIIEVEGLRAVPMPAMIDHLGYEGDQTAKHHRNLPMLERAVVADPKRPYLWLHLGLVRLALDDRDGAVDAWSHAVAIGRESREIGPSSLLAYVELALYRIRSGDSAAELLEELRAGRPDDPLTVWVAANQAILEQQWNTAIPLLESLLATNVDELDTEVGYNRAIFDAFAAHALGSCWFHLGDYGAAADLFARAETSDPSNTEYRVKRLLAEAHAGLG
jgi:hypothetical protein